MPLEKLCRIETACADASPTPRRCAVTYRARVRRRPRRARFARAPRGRSVREELGRNTYDAGAGEPMHDRPQRADDEPIKDATTHAVSIRQSFSKASGGSLAPEGCVEDAGRRVSTPVRRAPRSRHVAEASSLFVALSHGYSTRGLGASADITAARSGSARHRRRSRSSCRRARPRPRASSRRVRARASTPRRSCPDARRSRRRDSCRSRSGRRA